VPTHDLTEFFHYLNVSPWKIAVSEVGLGVPFTGLMTSIAGASKTLVYSECAYAKGLQPDIGKGSISREMAGAMADALWEKCEEFHSEFFATVAVTGAHKKPEENGETHAWICIRTGKGKSYLHFKIPKVYGREEAIALTCRMTAWLIDGILLKPKEIGSWNTYLPEVTPPIAVDVFAADGISTSTMLQWSSGDNPLIYHRGAFQRATPYLRRKNLRIYRGSFNPPTLAHQAIGENALFELSLTNARKSDLLDLESSYRLMMLDRLGIPVLITRDLGFFAEFHRELRAYQPTGATIEYVVGSDTFRDIVAPEYIFGEGFLDPLRSGAKFLVYSEPNLIMGNVIHENAKAQQLDYEEMPWPDGLLNIRSSYVRDDAVNDRLIRGVDPRIAEFIHQNINMLNWYQLERDRKNRAEKKAKQ
jgi:hypothetical protein